MTVATGDGCWLRVLGRWPLVTVVVTGGHHVEDGYIAYLPLGVSAAADGGGGQCQGWSCG